MDNTLYTGTPPTDLTPDGTPPGKATKKKLPIWARTLLVLAMCALVLTGCMFLPRIFAKRPPAEELLLTAAGLNDELRMAAEYNVSDRAQLLMLESAVITIVSDKRDSISATVSAPDASAILESIADSTDIENTDVESLTQAFCDRLGSGDFPRVENTVTAVVAKDDSGWYAESSRELLNAFFGGMLDYYEQLPEVSEQ